VAGRVSSETNALGAFSYAYDGATGRVLTNVFPNGLTVERGYGGNLEDRELQRITHRVGATPVSEFLYGRDHLVERITTWSQQVGATPPTLHTFGHDAADQLLSVSVTNSGNLINTFAYSYDPAGNRLTEQIGASNYTATHNALNQISTTTSPSASRTNEWDAKDRLVAVKSGNQRTEFTYDGLSRMVSIRQLTNSIEASFRRLVWCDNAVCEERNAAGAVTKRFFDQGTKLESGPNAGNYFYTRDHLGSIRELTDGSGAVRARYGYDPYGRQTKLMGDVETDFGFAGMFWVAEARLAGTRFRNYDPELGRWLSRDPLRSAELQEGPNLYAYVRNNPVNARDPLGLCCEKEKEWLEEMGRALEKFLKTWENQFNKCEANRVKGRATADDCYFIQITGEAAFKALKDRANDALRDYVRCRIKGCDEPPSCPTPPQPRPLVPPPNPFAPSPPKCSRDPISGWTYCK
jgi:RHS repeat-associated protein